MQSQERLLWAQVLKMGTKLGSIVVRYAGPGVVVEAVNSPSRSGGFPMKSSDDANGSHSICFKAVTC
jgi:hypothetical protein